MRLWVWVCLQNVKRNSFSLNLEQNSFKGWEVREHLVQALVLYYWGPQSEKREWAVTKHERARANSQPWVMHNRQSNILTSQRLHCRLRSQRMNSRAHIQTKSLRKVKVSQWISTVGSYKSGFTPQSPLRASVWFFWCVDFKLLASVLCNNVFL